MKYVSLLGMAILLFAGCTDDTAEGERTVTLNIPIEIYSSQTETTNLRAASQGDPGTNAEMKAPLYLYVYAYISEEGSQKEVLMQKFTFSDDETATDWTLKDENTVNERWAKNLRVKFKVKSTFDGTVGSSRVFAVASRTELTSLPQDATAATTAFGALTKFSTYTYDCSSFTSDQLKDVYSTPYNDQSSPVATTDNGVLQMEDDVLTCSAVKLYHVAAKADFTWEVPSQHQDSVSVASITCTNLPTTCKLFTPTDNPTGTGTCSVLTVANAGNKWIGREYAYVLQPPVGTLNYTVTYNGIANKAQTTATVTPTSLNTTFTTWYRVIANIKIGQ